MLYNFCSGVKKLQSLLDFRFFRLFKYGRICGHDGRVVILMLKVPY